MQEFTNDPIDISLLPQFQEVALNGLSPKYWKIVVINMAIFIAATTTGLTMLLLLNTEIKRYTYIIIGVYLVLIALMFVLYRSALKRRGFAVREKDIMYRHGLIAISTTIIPFSRIQHIALDEGLFSRMYQLGQLRIFTAGGNSGSLHIPGIEIEEAKQIKEMLMKQISLQE
jgi:membrane protein YdbS with pleckstrin-like domain